MTNDNDDNNNNNNNNNNIINNNNSFLFLHLLYIGLFLFSNEGIVDSVLMNSLDFL